MGLSSKPSWAQRLKNATRNLSTWPSSFIGRYFFLIFCLYFIHILNYKKNACIRFSVSARRKLVGIAGKHDS